MSGPEASPSRIVVQSGDDVILLDSIPPSQLEALRERLRDLVASVPDHVAITTRQL